MTRRAWGPRPPAGDDAMAQLVRTNFGISQLFVHGRLDGWFPRFMLGHQEFLFFGPCFTALALVLRVATFGLLSNVGVLKVIAVGSVVAIAPATTFLGTSIGLPRRAAIIAGVLALSVDNVFGVGIAGTFTISLIPQQVAAVGALVALGGVIRVVTDQKARWVGLTAVSVAVLLLTHLITLVIWPALVVLALGGMLFTVRPDALAPRRVMVAGLLAVGVSGFWIVPFVRHANLHGPVTAWATPTFGTRVGEIFRGNILFGPHLAPLYAAAWLWALYRLANGRRAATWAVPSLILPVGYLVYAYWALHHHFPTSEISLSMVNRGQGLAAIFMVFPLADLLATTSEAAGRLARTALSDGRLGSGIARWTEQLLGVAAFVAAVAIVLVVPGAAHNGTRITMQQPEVTTELRSVATALRSLVPSWARFATERDFPAEIKRSGVSHPDFWLAAESGRNTLNVFNLESSSVPGVVFAADTPGQLNGKSDPIGSANMLTQLGVTHVVISKPGSAAHLEASGRFHTVYSAGPFEIMTVAGAPNQPDPSSELTIGAPARSSPFDNAKISATARMRRATPGHLLLEAQVNSPSGMHLPAALAVAWSPKWHLRIDKQTTRTAPDQDGLLAFSISAGPHEIELAYSEDIWDRLGLALTTGTATVAARWAWSRRRRSASAQRPEVVIASQ